VTATIDDAGLRELGERIAGEIVLPGDVAWDAARQAWNLAVDQRPLAVVYPVSADDVVATVRHAAERGLRIAPWDSGRRYLNFAES